MLARGTWSVLWTMCPISQLRFLTTRGLSHTVNIFSNTDRPTPQTTVTVLSQRKRITTLLFTAVKAFFGTEIVRVGIPI